MVGFQRLVDFVVVFVLNIHCYIDITMNGIIYKLYNTENDKYYVGSTIQKLNRRLKDHRNQANNSTRQSKLYLEIRSINCDKWFIKELKEININNKIELIKHENDFINLMDINCLNCINSQFKIEPNQIIKSKNKVIDVDNEKYQNNLITEKNRAQEKRDLIKHDTEQYYDYLEYHKKRVKDYRERLKNDPDKYKIYLEKEKKRKQTTKPRTDVGEL